MKVRFKNTGNVVDFVAADWLFGFIEAGLVEEVKDAVRKPNRSNVAQWVVQGSGKSARIHVHCDACRQSSTWYEATDAIKLEHCHKVEKVPSEILEKYQQLRNVW